MRNGIIATHLDLSAPFAVQINAACDAADWFPYVTSAAQTNETGRRSDAETVISGDNGHGVMQVTPADWWPEDMVAAWAAIDWRNPSANINFAIKWFLQPAETYWAPIAQGEDLVRCILAEYNVGRDAAIEGHQAGDVDEKTTDHYADRGLVTYKKLCAGEAI